MQPVQLKMARAALDLTIDQLAAEAGVSHVEVARVESGESGDDGITARLKALFEQRGVTFIEDDTVRAQTTVSAETIPLDELNSANDE